MNRAPGDERVTVMFNCYVRWGNVTDIEVIDSTDLCFNRATIQAVKEMAL